MAATRDGDQNTDLAQYRHSSEPPGHNYNKQNTSDLDKELHRLQAVVRHNDAFNDLSRNRINHIFAVSQQLQNGAVAPEINEEFLKSIPGLPELSVSSIKALSIQLNKLRLLELRIRVNSLNNNITHLSKKNESMAKDLSQVQQQISTTKLAVKSTAQSLEIKSKDAQLAIQEDLEEYKANKIYHIQKQLLKSRQKAFNILKESVFVSPKPGQLYFYYQPVLKLSSFFGANIITINQLLENMITLQQHLAYLFDINMPYLKELIALLPNSRFFDLIKEKELFMTGRTEEEEQNSTILEDHSKLVKTENPEQIIKLGDTIKLPLSSKTINNQRRASLLRADSEPPIARERSLSISPSPKSPTKKMIIVPHKILNKSFSRLSIREFLRFLLVVAKIVSNFMVIVSTLRPEANELVLDFETILNIIQTSDLTLVTYRGQDLAGKLSLKELMEEIYKVLIKPSKVKSKRGLDPPSLLQDLNVSVLIANQAKTQIDDWDLVSKLG